MADYFTIPANRLHIVPDALDYRAAALVEPLATPVHAVHVAGDVHDKAVVILGAGTIGLLLLAVLLATLLGRLAAGVATVAAFLALNYFFTSPRDSQGIACSKAGSAFATFCSQTSKTFDSVTSNFSS